MKEFINIGSSPAEEDCFQTGDARCLRECRIYKRQLEREFPGGDFRVKSFPHDFGSYWEVVAYYNPEDEKETDLAFQAESEASPSWDDLALAEMAELCKELA